MVAPDSTMAVSWMRTEGSITAGHAIGGGGCLAAAQAGRW